MKKYESIVSSEYAPNNPNVLWENKGILHKFNNGKWVPIGDGTGGDIPEEKQKYWDGKQDKLKPGDYIEINNDTVSAVLDDFVKEDELASVATSNNYNDLDNKPDIEKIQQQIDALSLGAKLSLSASPTVVEKGKSVSYTIKATFTGVVPDVIEILDNGTVIGNVEKSDTLSVKCTETLTSNKKYTANATYNGMKFTASVSVTPVDLILYGFCDEGTDPTKTLSARTSALTTYEDTATKDNQRFCIYVPSGVTAPTKFSMGGAPASYTKGSKTINNINYTTFISDALYNSGAKLTIKAE